MILSLQRRKVLSRIILSFTITLAMIGIIDGGMFGTPAIGGLYGILILMFNGTIIDEISDFLTKKEEGKKDIKSILKEEWKVIKSVFLLRIKNNQKAIKKYFKIALPHIALILIIILRFSISFYGAAPDCYELTVYNGHDIDLENNYTVIDTIKNGNKTIIYLSNEYNEMELLNGLAIQLNGKCDWYSLSWNIYSYLN